jgi:hypothetical protein
LQLQQGIATSGMEVNRQFCVAKTLNRRCRLWVDTVEKGKNEPIEIFACASVETGFS